jgi:acetolactate synthase-1/2/3 large subunit
VSSLTTGQLFCETLQGYGVTHVFQIPAIFRSAMVAMDDTSVRRITTHHEVAAAYMADGYARASRRPGVCMGQSVANGNLAAGLRDAYLAGSPVVAVSGGALASQRYKGVYQVIEDLPMFDPVTKLNARIETPERLGDLLRQAFRVATTGTPGPVHLEIPGRTGEGIEALVDSSVIVEGQFARYPAFRPECDPRDIREAARLLTEAQRPVIVAGSGVCSSDARKELLDLADRLSIPVASSPSGRDCLPEYHPLSVGTVGTYGRSSANQLLDEADLVFFVGSRAGGLVTNEWHYPRPGTPVVQLDIEPTAIGRNYPVEVALCGDARSGLRQLTEALTSSPPRSSWVMRAQQLLLQWRGAIADHANSSALPMRPERMCKEISEELPSDVIVVSDTGHAAIWSGTMIELREVGQRYIRCAGTLGWAFPGSLGVKCALPDRPVLCFTGDGGLFYHIGELETAAREGINVVVLVNNNSALQQVIPGFDHAYGGTHSPKARGIWAFRDTNFARVAEDMGCLGLRVERPNDLGDALHEAFRANRAVVLDVVTDVEAAPAFG